MYFLIFLQDYEARFTISIAVDNIPASSFDNVHDPFLRILCYICEIALQSFICDIKNLVKDQVVNELTDGLDNRGPSGIAARQRRTALNIWLASPYPLSINQQVLPHLLMAILPINQQQMTLAASSLGRKSIQFFVDSIISQCTIRPRSLRPPFISKGRFYNIARIAIEEGQKLASGYGVPMAGYILLVKDAFRLACIELKINHVPWSRNPDGGRGAPSIRVVHNIWLNLGAVPPHSMQDPAPLLARHSSRQHVALRSSAATQLADPRADWNALDVKLLDFHTVLHKTSLPTEFNIALPSATFSESAAYIRDTYQYVQASYSRQNHLHHLALIASIACAGLLPNIYVSQKISPPNNPSLFKNFIRNLEWTSRDKKGSTQCFIFIQMVTFFIIGLYDTASPVSMRVDKKAWFSKHSESHIIFLNRFIFSYRSGFTVASKGITILLLCRLGLAKAIKPKAFASAQWMVDVRPLTSTEIEDLYQEVVDCFTRWGKYGGYDVAHLLMGQNAVKKLVDNNFVSARSIPVDSVVVSSGSKRSRELDASSDVEIVEETFSVRKVSRTH